MPFPSTKLIHQSWSTHHSSAVRGTQNATCTITVPGAAGGWDPETGPTPSEPGTVGYSGRCRVQDLSLSPRRSLAAEQPVTETPVLVTLPLEAPRLAKGSRVKVNSVDENGPEWLVGETLTVLSVRAASLSWEQDVVCTYDRSNQPGSAP